jgi:pimeloyl-ACP methyl ester carboxylesterase
VEWVPKQSSVIDRRGYHLSQLYSKYVSPASLLEAYRTGKNLTVFYNDKLGLPYVEAANRLSIGEVLDLCGNEGIAESDPGPTFAGVDQGGLLYITIAKRHPQKSAQIVYIGIHKDFTEIDHLMKRFNVVRAVIDGMPEVRKARELAGRHPGKIFLNYYNDHQRGSYRWDEKRRVVSCNRTESMDGSHAEVLNQGIILPRESETIRTFAAHCHNTAKRLEVDEESGSQKYTYIRLGEDHFRHSLNYCVMAYQSCPTFLFPELL